MKARDNVELKDKLTIEFDKLTHKQAVQFGLLIAKHIVSEVNHALHSYNNTRLEQQHDNKLFNYTFELHSDITNNLSITHADYIDNATGRIENNDKKCCVEYDVQKQLLSDAVATVTDTLKQWVSGEISCVPARECAFALHRKAKAAQDPIITLIYRMLGQVAASPHVKRHALVASDYAIKVINLLYYINSIDSCAVSSDMADTAKIVISNCVSGKCKVVIVNDVGSYYQCNAAARATVERQFQLDLLISLICSSYIEK